MRAKASNTLNIIKILFKLGGCATIDELCSELGYKKNYVHSYLSILRLKGVVRNVVDSDGRILYCLSRD